MKTKKNTTICVLGHCRHGKDSLAEIMNEVYGLTFKSSSQAAADIFLYDTLKDKYGKYIIEMRAEANNGSQQWDICAPFNSIYCDNRC